MMETKIIMLFIGIVYLNSCSFKANVCNESVRKGDRVEIHVMPLSTTQIINNEKEKGLVNKKSLAKRKKQIEKQMHLKIRIQSKFDLDELEIKYINDTLIQNLSMMKYGQYLVKSLLINETSFAAKNLMQYLIAFESNSEDKEGEIELTMNANKLGIDNNVIKFQSSCFQ